jgi:hypothetical protein
MASTLFFDKAIVPTLWNLLRRRPGSRLSIETPTRTVEIRSSIELTEDEVERLIASLGR